MGHWCIQMMAQMQKHAAVVCAHLLQNNHTQKSILPTKTAASASTSDAVAASVASQRKKKFNAESFVGKWEKWSYNCGKCGCLKISFAI